MTIEIIPSNREKNERLTEEERKLEIARNLEFSMEKQKLIEKIEKDKKLAYLKSLVERGLVKMGTIERIVAGEGLDNDDIREIFEKIDEIEQTVGIDEILPVELRITKAEYIQALDDQAVRKEVLVRLDASLDRLHNLSHPHANGMTSFLSEIFGFLRQKSQTIAKIQGNVIDVKRSVRGR